MPGHERDQLAVGGRRRAILEAQLACVDDTSTRQAREGEPDDPFTHGLRQSHNDLEQQKKDTVAAIAQLDCCMNSDQLPKTARTAEKISDAMTSTEPKNAADLSQLRSGGCCLYPRWDSNPRYRRERPAS
jgi:hypothetical protein